MLACYPTEPQKVLASHLGAALDNTHALLLTRALLSR